MKKKKMKKVKNNYFLWEQCTKAVKFHSGPSWMCFPGNMASVARIYRCPEKLHYIITLKI